jgi:hypothetical protein
LHNLLDCAERVLSRHGGLTIRRAVRSRHPVLVHFAVHTLVLLLHLLQAAVHRAGRGAPRRHRWLILIAGGYLAVHSGVAGRYLRYGVSGGHHYR